MEFTNVIYYFMKLFIKKKIIILIFFSITHKKNFKMNGQESQDRQQQSLS